MKYFREGSNFEQVLEATPHEAAAVRPPTSHHENMQDTAGEARTSSWVIFSY